MLGKSIAERGVPQRHGVAAVSKHCGSMENEYRWRYYIDWACVIAPWLSITLCLIFMGPQVVAYAHERQRYMPFMVSGCVGLLNTLFGLGWSVWRAGYGATKLRIRVGFIVASCVVALLVFVELPNYMSIQALEISRPDLFKPH